MTGLNMAKGFPLPLVRPNSKDAFGKLKDSEPGSGSIHGGKFSFGSNLSPVGPLWTVHDNVKYALCRFGCFDARSVHCADECASREESSAYHRAENGVSPVRRAHPAVAHGFL